MLNSKLVQQIKLIDETSENNRKKEEKNQIKSKENKEQMDNMKLKQYWQDLAKHEVPKFPRIYQKYKKIMNAEKLEDIL